jgi:hypothetical protein
MKNIHLIPTDKPSRLYLEDVKFKLTEYDYPNVDYAQNQHIYITNDEEIKEEDWVFGMDGIFQYKGKVNLPDVELPKKIILTTDLELIADGIQAIDDEFFEWFVKNPTCEYAHIGFIAHNDIREYKIIIPQEEPKTGSLLESIQEVTKDLLREINELKQETFEEIPKELEPILAKISHINDLGLSQWYEVVYYADDKWCSYSDSKTFEDGERVIDWKYCKEQFKNK